MPLAVTIVLSFVAIFALIRLARGWRDRASRGGGRSSLPCATCAHCGRLFDDGVLCRFEHREVFKTETHIANCVDYERRRRHRSA